MGKGYGSGRKPLNGEAVTEIEGNVGQGNIENLANGSDLAESEGAFAREATAENGRGDACRSCKLLVVHVAAQEQTVQFNVFLGIQHSKNLLKCMVWMAGGMLHIHP
jgi:hypothetical protein